MAPFPVERLKPYPAWNTTALDFFGPFEIKGLSGNLQHQMDHGKMVVPKHLSNQRRKPLEVKLEVK